MLIVASKQYSDEERAYVTHRFGIIDHDYCGPFDEIKILVYNFTTAPSINRGEK